MDIIIADRTDPRFTQLVQDVYETMPAAGVDMTDSYGKRMKLTPGIEPRYLYIILFEHGEAPDPTLRYVIGYDSNAEESPEGAVLFVAQALAHVGFSGPLRARLHTIDDGSLSKAFAEHQAAARLKLN